MYRCLHMWVSTYRCLYMWVYMYRCLHMWVSMYRCLHMWVSMYRCLHMWVSMYRCLHMWFSMYRCLHMCIAIVVVISVFQLPLNFANCAAKCLHCIMFCGLFYLAFCIIMQLLSSFVSVEVFDDSRAIVLRSLSCLCSPLDGKEPFAKCRMLGHMCRHFEKSKLCPIEVGFQRQCFFCCWKIPFMFFCDIVILYMVTVVTCFELNVERRYFVSLDVTTNNSWLTFHKNTSISILPL